MRIPTSDPVTGDAFGPGEGLSWVLQGFIRRWTFLILFTSVTIPLWALGSPAVLGWWNYGASFLAIMIESVVGIGFFNMARRDSKVLRHVMRDVVRIATTADRLEALAELIHENQLRSE